MAHGHWHFTGPESDDVYKTNEEIKYKTLHLICAFVSLKMKRRHVKDTDITMIISGYGSTMLGFCPLLTSSGKDTHL